MDILILEFMVFIMLIKKLDFENAYKNYIMLQKQYDELANQYQIKYESNNDLIKTLLFPLEMKVIDAEREFLEKFFEFDVNRLNLLRYLYSIITNDDGGDKN